MSNIVISGANQGIGYYMAERLLALGNRVAVLDLEIGALSALSQAYGQRLLPFQCDMRSSAGVNAAVNEAAQAFGSVDIAIHNACRCTFEAAEDTGEDVYRDVFDVNYFGALRLTKAVLPHMRRQRHGKIIFTSSGVGVMGFFNISPYASSKGALEALAKCLGLECGEDGVTFHIFQPPLTRTKSAEPLPVPKEFLADPKAVGYGLARQVNSKKFVICHSRVQALQTKLCYLFPIQMGRLLSGKLRQLTDK